MSFTDFANDAGLLVEDAANLLLGSLTAPSWGVYLNGSPVITPATPYGGGSLISALSAVASVSSVAGSPNISPCIASTVEFEYAQEWPISTYPQEQGAFQAYDKVTMPFDVKLRLAGGGSVSDRQAFLQTCMAISNSFSLFDVVTPEMVFSSVNCTHINWRRTAEHGVSLISVDLWFKEIPVTASANFGNTQQPGAAGQQSNGAQQPQTTTNSTQQNIVPGAVN
jgi:hypothetical protein